MFVWVSQFPAKSEKSPCPCISYTIYLFKNICKLLLTPSGGKLWVQPNKVDEVKHDCCTTWEMLHRTKLIWDGQHPSCTAKQFIPSSLSSVIKMSTSGGYLARAMLRRSLSVCSERSKGTRISTGWIRSTLDSSSERDVLSVKQSTIRSPMVGWTTCG